MQNFTAPAPGSATPAHLLSANLSEKPAPTVEYFVALDYSFLDKWLGVLSGNAFRVLVYLRRRRGANLEARPKKRTIAKDLHLSEKTVERMLDELAKHGIIEARAFFDPARDGRQCANRYHFLVETHILYPRPLSKVTPPPPIKVTPPIKEMQREPDSSEKQQPDVAVSKDKSSVFAPSPEIPPLLARLEKEAGLNAAAATKMLKVFGFEKVTMQLNWLPDRSPDVPAKVLWASLKHGYDAPHRVQAPRPYTAPAVADESKPTLANGGLKFVPQGTPKPESPLCDDSGTLPGCPPKARISAPKNTAKNGTGLIVASAKNPDKTPAKSAIDREALLREMADDAPRLTEAEACDAVFNTLPDAVTWPVCTDALDKFPRDAEARQFVKRAWILEHHSAAVAAHMEANR